MRYKVLETKDSEEDMSIALKLDAKAQITLLLMFQAV